MTFDQFSATFATPGWVACVFLVLVAVVFLSKGATQTVVGGAWLFIAGFSFLFTSYVLEVDAGGLIAPGLALLGFGAFFVLFGFLKSWS